MLRSLDISTSAMSALQTKLEVVSNNLANSESLTDADGNYNPYRRRKVFFQPGDPSRGTSFGVHVERIIADRQAPLQKRYEPGSEYADAQGYVSYPNVNPLEEMTDAMVTIRSYQANVTAFEATKSMASSALRLLA
jgi:flagellar basal-body rod protein FlgC